MNEFNIDNTTTTPNLYIPFNPWDDYCDCDKCPCCGKRRRRKYSYPPIRPWMVTYSGTE